MTIEYKDSKRIVALSSDALVAHLKFNDNVTDSAGSNNGTVTGTTTYVTGKVGKGISLNGSSYVTLANESNFDFEHTNPFSITFWIKMNSGSDGGTYYVAAKQNAGGGQVGLGLLLLSNGELRFGFDTASGNHRITSSNSVVTVSSGWTHVSITYDGSSNLSGCKIYINGTLDVTGSSSSITSTVLNNYAFVWGASSDGSLDTPATYDDTRIYSRELDQNEVSVIYNGGTGTEGDLKPTDVQDNSLLVEKDTARRYWFTAESENTKTVDDDFSGADNWTDSDSTIIGVNTTTDVLDFKEKDGNFDEVSYYAITALGTDANFTLRLKLNIGTITQTGNTDSVRTLIGISSDNDIPTETARDEVGIIWRVTDTINKFYAFTADGIALPTSGTDFATTPSTTGGDGSGNYYVEIIGDSGTYTFKLFSDSTYDTLIESESITDAGITGLDNIVIRSSTLTTTNNQARGYIDDVKFYDGVTSATTPAAWLRQKSYISKSGCLIYYNFEQTSGNLTNQATTANGFTDGLGSTGDGTSSGTVGKSNTGKVGSNAWSFDGSSGKTASSNSSDLILTGDTSWAGWIKIDSSTSTGAPTIFSVRGGATNNQIDNALFCGYVSKNTSPIDLIVFHEHDAGTNVSPSINIDSNLSTGVWYHFAVTRDVSEKQYSVYLNGSLLSTHTYNTNPNTTATSLDFELGHAVSDDYFDGMLDEVSLWNRVLTADEISALYNSGYGAVI